MQELLGYDFFVFEDGVPMELDDAYGQQYGQNFNRKVNKLAYEIADLLKTLEASNEEAATPASDKPVVYLAECTYDMRQTRDAIESQLNCLGYQILPDKNLPIDEEGYISAVSRLLERSQLSVHLIGKQYGAVPHGPNDESTAYVQNRLAAQLSQNSDLQRLIWLGNESSPSEEKQQRFIDELHSDAQSQCGADLLTGDVEKLKSAIQSLLNNIETKASSTTFSEDSKGADDVNNESSVYLICTEQDRKATVPLRKYLREQAVTVSMPAFQGDAAQVREINQELLTNSNRIIVFYGAGEEAWKRSIDTELRKLPAYLKGRPAPSVYTYLSAPNTCDKDDMVDMVEPGILNGIDDLNTLALDNIFSQSVSVKDES